MSSDILSRPIDVGKFALIHAGARKNLGLAVVWAVESANSLEGTSQAVGAPAESILPA